VKKKIRPDQLTKIYHELTWDSYVAIANAITEIEKDDLEHELLVQARMYSYWCGLLNRAKKDYDKAKRLLESTEAVAKNTLLKEGSKLSDKKLESLIKSEETYIKKQEGLERAAEKLGYFQSLVKALEHRKDMLVQISSNRKTELKLNQ